MDVRMLNMERENHQNRTSAERFVQVAIFEPRHTSKHAIKDGGRSHVTLAGPSSRTAEIYAIQSAA